MLSKSTEEHKTVLTHKTLNMDPRQDFFYVYVPILKKCMLLEKKDKKGDINTSKTLISVYRHAFVPVPVDFFPFFLFIGKVKQTFI